MRLETQAATEADAVVAITHALKDELVRRGVPGDRITVIPNHVDVERFTPQPRDRALEQLLGLEGQRVIGFIGSITQYEGLDDFLHAACIVIDRGVDLRLLIVGDGSGLSRLKYLVSELELENEVILTGRVPFGEVQRYYSLIDVAAFPRKPQPVTEMVSPLKHLEAMAMEKTVLVSSVAALAEAVVDGETGVVFEKGNIDDLADQLERLVRDPALTERLGQNARRWVAANRSWAQGGEEFAKIYRRLQGRA